MINRLFLLPILLCLTSVCRADITILMRFDEAGHHIHRVVAVENESAIDGLIASRRSSSGSPKSGVRIQWYDRSGRLLSTSYLQDPRRTHAPVTGNQSLESATWIAMQQGAYRVTGPDEAMSIVVELPARVIPLLQAERWVLTIP